MSKAWIVTLGMNIEPDDDSEPLPLFFMPSLLLFFCHGSAHLHGATAICKHYPWSSSSFLSYFFFLPIFLCSLSMHLHPALSRPLSSTPVLFRGSGILTVVDVFLAVTEFFLVVANIGGSST